MKPSQAFLNKPLEFWANVKLISQRIGYTNRKTKAIKIYTLKDISKVYKENKLSFSGIFSEGVVQPLANDIIEYSKFRAEFLNERVRPLLMTSQQAREEFYVLREKLAPNCHLPLNNQKAAKQDFAFLTGIVNMLIEANINGLPVDYNPQALTSIVHSGRPMRTLSRRVDGAFPSTLNPIAIWEIKEYYHTTTFGSRVADGIYETQLDGYEVNEIRKNLNTNIEHYLIVDAYGTWWEKGRSYLCRICDMMHMGTLTEALFGREVFDRIPAIAKNWVDKYSPEKSPSEKTENEIVKDLKESIS